MRNEFQQFLRDCPKLHALWRSRIGDCWDEWSGRYSFLIPQFLAQPPAVQRSFIAWVEAECDVNFTPPLLVQLAFVYPFSHWQAFRTLERSDLARVNGVAIRDDGSGAIIRWHVYLTPDNENSLSMGDLINLRSLARKLKQVADPVSICLKNLLSQETQKALVGYEGSKPNPLPLETALVKDLNRIIHGQSLYDAERFAGVGLRPETRQLLAENPQGDALVRLHRLLLEDAFPLEIADLSLDAFQSAAKRCEIDRDEIENLHNTLCRFLRSRRLCFRFLKQLKWKTRTHWYWPVIVADVSLMSLILTLAGFVAMARSFEESIEAIVPFFVCVCVALVCTALGAYWRMSHQMRAASLDAAKRLDHGFLCIFRHPADERIHGRSSDLPLAIGAMLSLSPSVINSQFRGLDSGAAPDVVHGQERSEKRQDEWDDIALGIDAGVNEFAATGRIFEVLSEQGNPRSWAVGEVEELLRKAQTVKESQDVLCPKRLICPDQRDAEMVQRKVREVSGVTLVKGRSLVTLLMRAAGIRCRWWWLRLTWVGVLAVLTLGSRDLYRYFIKPPPTPIYGECGIGPERRPEWKKAQDALAASVREYHPCYRLSFVNSGYWLVTQTNPPSGPEKGWWRFVFLLTERVNPRSRRDDGELQMVLVRRFLWMEFPKVVRRDPVKALIEPERK